MANHNGRGAICGRVVKIIQAIGAGPKTAKQLAEDIGMDATCVGRWLRALQAAGLVRIDGHQQREGHGQRAWLWTWVGHHDQPR